MRKRPFAMPVAVMAAAAILCGIGTQSAQAALAVGAKAPDFTTRGAKGGRVFRIHLAEALKKGPVVLYFFPAAFTPGCTAEAHEFAERSADFEKAGATIIGMAADPVDKLARFSREACRDKFAVASAGPDVVKAYDVALAGFPGGSLLTGRTDRTSYVIAQSGRIAYVHSEMDYRGHVSGTLGAVRSLKRR